MINTIRNFARSMFSPSFRAGRAHAKRIRREMDTAMRVVRARYDAAQTHEHNANHWAMADGMSARTALSPGVRKQLRERSRYEYENNSWLSGIVDTLANHTIGIGPRLQIMHPNEAACLRVQQAFSKWAKAVRFAEKLLTLKTAWGHSGEAFALLTRNKNLWPIQLDLRLYEPEQIASPYASYDPSIDDGIHIDKYGVPDSYFILNHHPGDQFFGAFAINQGEWYDAKNVLHYFHAKRPGQIHGIPPLTPSLELAPILRRFSRAAIKAAEVAASHTSIMKTTAGSVEVAGSPADFAPVEFEAGMNTILPEGWDVVQMDAKHPNSTYEMVVRVILNEIARPVHMPFNIAACNSAGYNYSSGRLDHQTYYKSIEVDQSIIESCVLDRILNAWLEEAAMVPGLLDGFGPISELNCQWCWDAQPVIDEGTDAIASTQRIQSGQSTLPLEWQRRGYGDVQAQLTKGAEAFGLTVDQYQQLLQFQNFGATFQQLSAAAAAMPAPTAPPAQGGQSSAPVQSAGAFVRTRITDFRNNTKSVNEVLDQLMAGDMSEAMARVSLGRLGLVPGEIETLIVDARDGSIDSASLDGIEAPA